MDKIISKNFGYTLFIKENIPLNEEWQERPFTQKEYSINGTSYTLIGEKTRSLPTCSSKRITGLVLGILSTLFSLGIAYFASSTVQQWIQGRQIVKILQSPTSENPTPPSSIHLSQINLSRKETAAPLPNFNWAPKAFTVKQAETSDFNPLSDQQVLMMLDEHPELKEILAAQGKMTAHDSIFSIQQEGIPARLGAQTTSNIELRDSMRYILWRINQIADFDRKKEELLDVARCVEDCVPVTQGRIAKKHMQYTAIGGIEEQLLCYIDRIKDETVDAVIYEMYPAMQNPNYAEQNFYHPSLQFPHVKSGYLVACSEKLGLSTVGAIDDPNANHQRALAGREKFLDLFISKFSLDEAIRNFIIDVNSRAGLIVNLHDLANWCNQENLGDLCYQVSYDAEAGMTYPSYSPPPPKNGDYFPYLNEEMAYKIFEKLGFIAEEKLSTESIIG